MQENNYLKSLLHQTSMNFYCNLYLTLLHAGGVEKELEDSQNEVHQLGMKIRQLKQEREGDSIYNR